MAEQSFGDFSGNTLTCGPTKPTLIYIRHMWQGIEILNLWSIGVVHDRAILAVRNSENVFQRLALCVLDNGVIEFFAANKVNGRAILWRLLRQHAHVRTDKTYFD